ncbi:helicase [Coemansia asiatica]|uniref:RNA helicase n=1 Tax=Coemansia asiatica TaxID=1052880 RepID=A0A9W7XG74_9FUNG|nr:helicase [Coemansia asiatica]
MTSLEAKHMAATYALYRMRSDTSLYLSLPLVHRKYWELLRQNREAPWMYNGDPFAAQAERDREKEGKRVEHARREEKKVRAEMGHREELLRPGSRRRWDEMAEVRMVEKHRMAVEDVVRRWTQQWDLQDDNGSKDPVNVDELVDLGFHRMHVLEALAYAGSRDGVVDWLCVHVPEDDLPRRFQRHREAPRVVVLDDRAAGSARRLRRCGFPMAAVDGALAKAKDELGLGDAAAIEACAADVLVSQLCRRDKPRCIGSVCPEASERALAEEAETLRAIFFGEEEDERVIAFESGSSLSVLVRPQGLSTADSRLVGDDLRLEVWLPPGIVYPDESLPAMALSGSCAPAFVRLQATMKINSMVAASGLPVVFDAVQMIEEQLAQWIAAPLPLVSLKMQDIDSRAAGPLEAAGTGVESARGSRQRHGSRAKSDDVAGLSAQFLKLQLDPAYQAMQETRSNLPAHSLKDQILRLVSSSRCVLVTGATGCGKTTQVPQFILDSALQAKMPVNIVCTQPRRISAIGVAARVSEERCETMGSGVVGYAVRGDSRQSNRTRLLFCTTGVMLRMLVDRPDLQGVTHVVCDEVHERSVDSDMLLALLIGCLRKNPGLRVVLMSATAQCDVFAEYFGRSTPVVDIPGRAFPVEDLFLEDFVSRLPAPDAAFGAALVGRARARLQQQKENENEKDGEEEEWFARVKRFERRGCSRLQAASVAQWDERFGLRESNASNIDVSLAAAAVRYIDGLANKQQAVLVFMPGVAEIHALVDSLKGDPSLSVLSLHAGLAPSDQRRVFDRPPPGRRKVVVATNIAETSITIDDIGFVVDSGRVREAIRDPESGISRLATRFCSQAASTQRRGRAGRVSKGICIRLFTRETLHSAMSEFATPEILRMPLEQVCLQAKALGYANSAKFLCSMLTPPPGKAVESAERVLVAVGACEEGPAGELTPLGRFMADVPADLRLAKMLVYSAVFGVLDRALVLAALMAHDKPLFAASFENRELAREERLRFAVPGSDGEKSDWLADLRAYEYVTSSNNSKSSGGSSLQHVSRAVVRDIKGSVRMLRDSLKTLGLVDGSSSVEDGDSTGAVLRAMVFAGLSPNIARVRVPAQKYREVIGGGSVGIDHQAKELMFFAVDSVARQQDPVGWMDHDLKTDRRVFVHPQSTMFAHAKYPVPFVTYFSLTQSASTSGKQRTYMRDVTVPGFYALLMFGPPLVVDPEHKVVCIGPSGGLAVRAWPRVAALVNHLRRLLDELLRRKMADPSLRFKAHPVVEAVLRLIKTDGQ